MTSAAARHTSQHARGPTSPKRLARIAGLLYLGLALFMGFAALGARENLVVSGDAAATAANVVDNATLFRLADLASYITGIDLVVDGGLLALP